MAEDENLTWLVKNRAANQDLSLAIYLEITAHRLTIKENGWEGIPQILISVSFSLWRAVFISDLDFSERSSLDDAVIFYEKLIRDNAISYFTEKASKNWAFLYYINNAASHLELLHQQHDEVFPSSPIPNFEIFGPHEPQQAWLYVHFGLKRSFEIFKEALGSKKRPS